MIEHLTFKLEKETKGTLRYQEVDKNGVHHNEVDKHTIGTLYIRKASSPRPFPPIIHVDVNFGEVAQ